MEVNQVKNILEKKYPTGKVSPSYFLLNGKYYSGIIFKAYENVPESLEANPLDRGLACVSVDSNTGKIESYASAHDMMEIYKKGNCTIMSW